MLSRLIQFSLSQRLFMVLATLLLTGAGWYAYRGLPIDAFPDVASTQVKVIMKAPGMTPEEVESRIAVPIEVEMLGIPKTKILRSVTKYGLVDVTIDFQDGTDIYWARQQVSERLGNLSDSLPDGISGGMAPITTPLGEMFMFTVDGTTLSLVERRSLLDWVIRPALRTVPGVADVNSLGGQVRTFEVLPDPIRMAASGVSLEQLTNAVNTNNRNDGAGRLGEGDEVLLVRSEGSIRTLDDLRAVVVNSNSSSPVRVGDLAEVRLGTLHFRQFPLAAGLHHAPAIVQRNAVELEIAEHAQAVEEQLRLVQQRQAFPGHAAERAGLVDPGDTYPGRMQLAGHQWQQRAAAGDQGIAQGLHHAALDLQLQAAEEHHPGQGPAGKRHAALMAAGGQEQVRILHLVQLFRLVEDHQALAVATDHAAVQAQVDVPGAGGEIAPQFFQHPGVARAEVGRIDAGPQGAAIDHPAGTRGLVEEDAGDPAPGQLDGCGHAGRAAADDHRAQVHGRSSWSKRLLSVSTRMPGRTTVWQARRLGRPSMATRQQWHTPMPQKAPLAWPWSLRASRRRPTALSTLSTVSPAAAATGWPLRWMVMSARERGWISC